MKNEPTTGVNGGIQGIYLNQVDNARVEGNLIKNIKTAKGSALGISIE